MAVCVLGQLDHAEESVLDGLLQLAHGDKVSAFVPSVAYESLKRLVGE